MNLNKYIIQTEKQNVKQFIKKQVKKHLETNPENQGEIEHIIDMLNSEDSPLTLKYSSYEEMKNRAEKWVQNMIKKSEKVIETEQDTKVKFVFDNGFKLVQLVGKAAFEREGNLMSHCVASYHGKKGIEVYSLRDAKNNPHCTFEINKDNVNQIKGKGNGSIHPKYISYVLECLDLFGIKIRDSEMSNLGYISLDSKVWKELDRNYHDVKCVTFNGKRYYFSGQKLIKIPEIK